MKQSFNTGHLALRATRHLKVVDVKPATTHCETENQKTFHGDRKKTRPDPITQR